MPNNTSVPVPAGIPTYGAALPAIALAGACTDFATITGVAGRTIMVVRMLVNGIATAATAATMLVVKRTTANTGGTPAAVSGVLFDWYKAASPAEALTPTHAKPSAALIQSYTANPTLGTATAPAGGNLHVWIVPLGTATAPAPVQTIIDFTTSEFPTLRGPTDVLAINANAATIAGALVNVTFEYYELENETFKF